MEKQAEAINKPPRPAKQSVMEIAAAEAIERGQPDLLPSAISYTTKTLPAIASARAVSAPTAVIASGHRLGFIYGQRPAIELRSVQRTDGILCFPT